MSDFNQSLNHLSSADPVLAEVIKTHRLEPITPHQNYYHELISSIISQQLSVKAAATIEARFMELFDNQLPSPEAILERSIEELRSIGLSRPKAGYMQDLALKTISGEVQFDHLGQLDDEAVVAELIKIKGVGEWTAHMFLLFCMGRSDVLPVGDLGIRVGIQKLYRLDAVPAPNEVAAHAIAHGWHPYASTASRLIWKSLDNEPKL